MSKSKKAAYAAKQQAAATATSARQLQSLVEMARWRDARHASDARIILGRIAGIEEKRLIQLVAASEVDEIVRSLPRIK